MSSLDDYFDDDDDLQGDQDQDDDDDDDDVAVSNDYLEPGNCLNVLKVPDTMVHLVAKPAHHVIDVM